MTTMLTPARLRAVPVLIAAGLVQWLLWRAGSSAAGRVGPTVSDPVRRADPSLTGQLVVDTAMMLVLLAGTWLVVATVVTVLAHAGPARVRRRCPALAPRPWRRLVVGLLGTGVLALPVVVPATANTTHGKASDDPAPAGPQPAGDTGVGLLDGLPYPDRPTAARAARPGRGPAARPHVTVRPGDSLWALAAAADPTASDAQIAEAWPAWYAGNRERIGPDPDLLTPGTVLYPPRRP